MARALIIDQIGDAIVVVSPGGRVLDLNLAAVDLLRGMNPDAPTKLVGASAQALFGEGIASPGTGRPASCSPTTCDAGAS